MARFRLFLFFKLLLHVICEDYNARALRFNQVLLFAISPYNVLYDPTVGKPLSNVLPNGHGAPKVLL